MASEAVKVRVTSSPGLANVLVVLLEAILMPLSTGAVVSGNEVLKLAVGEMPNYFDQVVSNEVGA